jgi:CRP-like cAMP-binding protein
MLSVMEVILALKSTPLFRNVPGEGLKRLSDFIQEKEVAAGEVVFREEDFGDEMYLVRSGQINIHQELGDAPSLIEMVMPGGYFGEMAIIDDLPRTATATAEVDTSLLVLHKNDFRTAVQDYPDIAFEIFREFTRRLRRSDRKYRELLLEARRLGLETR